MSKKSEYKVRNQAYLAEKANDPRFMRLEKGVLARAISSGPKEGRTPELRSVVCVHYTGSLINGRTFDDSRMLDCPAAFRLNEVIEGWQIALRHMRPGDRWEIVIPAELGYGSRGDSEIPGNSTLIFDVELLSIV